MAQACIFSSRISPSTMNVKGNVAGRQDPGGRENVAVNFTILCVFVHKMGATLEVTANKYLRREGHKVNRPVHIVQFFEPFIWMPAGITLFLSLSSLFSFLFTFQSRPRVPLSLILLYWSGLVKVKRLKRKGIWISSHFLSYAWPINDCCHSHLARPWNRKCDRNIQIHKVLIIWGGYGRRIAKQSVFDCYGRIILLISQELARSAQRHIILAPQINREKEIRARIMSLSQFLRPELMRSISSR